MRRTILLLLLVLGLGAALRAEAPSPPAFPKGELIPKVDCTAEPGQSYALYIPRGYTPGRRSPILYILDSRGRAELPARLFQAGAEKYGYLLASSYNSASDVPVARTLNAMQAMWNDTHRRFAVDDKRVYVAGFSGTVRAACFMGQQVPGSITGVVGAGAGFPSDRQPTAKTPFLFFGTVGDRDFNYDEVQILEGRLSALRLPHRIETFAGPHQWMPEELATASLAWLDLRAMKAGTKGQDPAEVEDLWQQDLTRARAFEAAGQPVPALRLYSAMADDYDRLRDPAEARRKAVEIAASPQWKTTLRKQETWRKRDQAFLAESERTLAGITADSGPWSLGKVAADLHLAELRGKAKGETDEALSARRVLNSLYAQTSFYLPQQALAAKHYALAGFFGEVSAAIRPEDPAAWYNLACLHAQGGQKKKALDELRKAADLGWNDAEMLERDPDLAALRSDPDWPGVLLAVRQKAKPGAKP